MVAEPAFPVVSMAPTKGALAFFETEDTFTLRPTAALEVGVLNDVFLIDSKLRRWTVRGVAWAGFEGGWLERLDQFLSRRRRVRFDLVRGEEMAWPAVADSICALMDRSYREEGGEDADPDERAEFQTLRKAAVEAGGVGEAGTLLGFSKAGWGNWLTPGGAVGRLEFSCVTIALALLVGAAIWLIHAGLASFDVWATAAKILGVPCFFVWFVWVALRLHGVGVDWRWAWLVSPAVLGGGIVAIWLAKTAPTIAIAAGSIAGLLLAVLCFKKSLPEDKRPVVQ